MNLASANTITDAERIFNWAENQFDVFPTHEPTQTLDPWLYRFYSKSGVYVGINQNDNTVYVLGGVFGDEPQYVDTVQNILQVVLPSELEDQRLNDILKRSIQAESDIDFQPDTGFWSNPDRPGSSLDIHLSGSQLLLFWSSFDENGLTTWYQAVNEFDGTKNWSADLLRFNYDNATGQAVSTLVGSVNLQFFDGKLAFFSWDLNGSSGSEYIEQQITSEIRPAVSFSDVYQYPDDPTWWITANLQGTVLSMMVYGYDGHGKPRWFSGIKTGADLENSASIAVKLFSYTDGFSPNAEQRTPIGNPGGDMTIFMEEFTAIAQSAVTAGQLRSNHEEILKLGRPINSLSVNA